MDKYTEEEAKQILWGRFEIEDEEDAKEILSQSDIFTKIVEKELSKSIEGEKNARFVLFLCVQGRLVENYEPCSYNILINSE